MEDGGGRMGRWGKGVLSREQGAQGGGTSEEARAFDASALWCRMSNASRPREMVARLARAGKQSTKRKHLPSRGCDLRGQGAQ